jgi:hypothetical protein
MGMMLRIIIIDWMEGIVTRRRIRTVIVSFQFSRLHRTLPIMSRKLLLSEGRIGWNVICAWFAKFSGEYFLHAP